MPETFALEMSSKIMKYTITKAYSSKLTLSKNIVSEIQSTPITFHLVDFLPYGR